MKQKVYSNSKIEDIDDKGIVTIPIAGIGNTDEDKEVLLKGAFTKTIAERLNKIYHLIDHRWNFETMVGVPLNMFETETQLITRSKINLNIAKGKDLFAQYKFFAENNRSFEHSVGFDAPSNKFIVDKSSGVVMFSEVILYEYSSVLLGKNSNTETLDVKSLEQMLNYNFTYETLVKIEKHLNELNSNKQTNILELLNSKL